jgi:NTP pyrophosphatase (non-canonical NTP hydrolase)
MGEWLKWHHMLDNKQFVAAVSDSCGQELLREWANELVLLCHGVATEAGWHKKPRETGTMLMLMVSELAEAMEGDRKDLMDDKLPHRKMLEVELADCLIRICDFAGLKGMDLGGAVAEKLLFNTQRPDHKPENRELAGGKNY